MWSVVLDHLTNHLRPGVAVEPLFPLSGSQVLPQSRKEEGLECFPILCCFKAAGPFLPTKDIREWVMGATLGSVSPPRSAMVPQAPPWSSTEHSVKTHFLDALSLLYRTHFLQPLLSLPPAASKFHGKASNKHSGYNDIV